MSPLYWMEGEPATEGMYLCAWYLDDEWVYLVGLYEDGRWYTLLDSEPMLFHRIYHPHDFFRDLDQEAADLQGDQADSQNRQTQSHEDHALPFLGLN